MADTEFVKISKLLSEAAAVFLLKRGIILAYDIVCGQKKRFEDSLGVTLKSCGIPQNDWEKVAISTDDGVWRARCRASTNN